MTEAWQTHDVTNQVPPLVDYNLYATDTALQAAVSVFDVFEGASLGPDKKSVALEVSIQPVEKTLTDEDFEALAKRVVDNVGKQTGGVLRG